MSDQEYFDNWSDKLEEYDSPLDIGQQWVELDSKMSRPKKYSRWFLLLFIILMSGVILLKFFDENQEGNQPQNETQTSTLDLKSLHSNSAADKERVASTNENLEEGTATNENAIHKSSSISEPSNVSEQVESLQREILPAPLLTKVPVQEAADKAPVLEETPVENALPVTDDTYLTPSIDWLEKSILPLLDTDIPRLAIPRSLDNYSIYLQLPAIDGTEKGRPMVYLTTGLGKTAQRLMGSSADSTLRSDENEQALETVSVELGARWSLSKRAYASTGIFYNNWIDRFSADYTTEQEFGLENVLLQRIENQITGEVQEIFGDTTVIGTRSVSAVHYNQYQSFGVVLGVGINIWGRGRWHLDLGLNALLEMRLTAKGRYLSQQDQISDLGDYGHSRNRLGWNARAQLSLSYDLRNSWAILFSPYVQNRFSNMIDNDNNRITYWRAGANLGIGYRF